MNSSVKKIRIVMVRVRVTWSLYYFLLLVKTPRNNWTRKQIQQTPTIPCEGSHIKTYHKNGRIRSRKKRWKRPSGTSTIIKYIATFSRDAVKEKAKGRNWKTTRTLQRQLVKRRLTSYAPELDANDTIEPIVRWGSEIGRYIDKTVGLTPLCRLIILLPRMGRHKGRDEQPASINHHASTINHQSSSINHQPSTSGKQRPITTSEVWTMERINQPINQSIKQPTNQ